jgi:hypothetical protein
LTDARLKEVEKAAEIALASMGKRVSAEKEITDIRVKELEKAVTVAATAMDRRLDSMNEFRSTINDQANKFVRRKFLNGVKK